MEDRVKDHEMNVRVTEVWPFKFSLPFDLQYMQSPQFVLVVC